MKVTAIFGPPGTGKTRSLIEIAKKEKDARGILYLSYTKAAAEEATSRVIGKVSPSTIHSFAFRELNMNRAAVVDKIKLREFGLASGIPFMGTERGSDEPQEGDEYSAVLQYAHNRIIEPMEAWQEFGCPGTQVRFENFVSSYTKWKETYGFMDFDDMLIRFQESKFLSRSAEVVILDEAQDCTPLQWLSFIKIVDNAKRVYIAGDDDQAIYEWSGANPHGMVQFAEEHEGTLTVLNQSFRVPFAPWQRSQELIEQVGERVPKQFAHRVGTGLVTHYGDIWNFPLAKWAKGGGMILCRDQFRRREIERSLQQDMIPYDVLGGSSPWTNRTAQDLRDGKKPEINPFWQRFYRHWDPNAEIKVQLSTIHQAKGRESHSVIVDCAMTPRVQFNAALNRDAEIRVWYVALTRTSDELHICGENIIV